MKELTEREKQLLAGLSATAKSALSAVPGIGQAIAGWDGYNREKLDQSIKAILKHLQEKVSDLESFFTEEWLKSENGRQYSWKVVDSALDVQLADKQELFVNAFVNGVQNQNVESIEKLKFLDMLRHLSLASLMVLAEVDKMFEGQVRRPDRPIDPVGAFPLVDAEAIAEKLIDKFDPYLTISAVKELESEGLFSKTGQWSKTSSGQFFKGGGFQTELCYTDFSARFAEFISNPDETHNNQINKGQG